MGEREAVTALCYSPAPSCSTLYAASGSSVHCIDARTPEGVACTLACGSEELNSLAVHAKGAYLAAANDAGDVQVRGCGPPCLCRPRCCSLPAGPTHARARSFCQAASSTRASLQRSRLQLLPKA